MGMEEYKNKEARKWEVTWKAEGVRERRKKRCLKRETDGGKEEKEEEDKKGSRNPIPVYEETEKEDEEGRAVNSHRERGMSWGVSACQSCCEKGKERIANTRFDFRLRKNKQTNDDWDKTLSQSTVCLCTRLLLHLPISLTTGEWNRPRTSPWELMSMSKSHLPFQGAYTLSRIKSVFNLLTEKKPVGMGADDL